MNPNFPEAESGYEAWLRYTPFPPERKLKLRPLLRLHVANASICVDAAVSEWGRAFQGFLHQETKANTPSESAGVIFDVDDTLPAEGYRVIGGTPLRIIGGDPKGLLYGVFAVLRQLAIGIEMEALSCDSRPAIPMRLLNHWDNQVIDPVHGSIERVKGGDTIFDWTDLTRPNPRYEDYARLLASVGLNGTCLNNVNAEPEILDHTTIHGLAAVAGIFRRWGIRIYVSVNFATPALKGELSNADPLVPAVQNWWKEKADEIYALIPDFGGFVVKADSEGKPGPGTYGRSHVEGSQCLARALKPHGGTLFWRAFVYGRDLSDRVPDPLALKDRANHASYEFIHLDGQFDDNVVLQVKCSAVDFQIEEPPHAIFGKMPNTRLALEMALTKEYSGYDIHMNWEGGYFHRILNFDTKWDANGHGRIADIIAGHSAQIPPGAITAVANINNSRNWFGHLLHGATLYTYARLAWTPVSNPQEYLDEWTRLTFGQEAAPKVSEIMKNSYSTVAHYTMPMGMTYISEFLHHFEPDPWENHQSAGITDDGIGYDRTSATGSGYSTLYHPDHASAWENPGTCPLHHLLYFHHLPWKHEMPDGETLIQTLYDSYYDGVTKVIDYRRQWTALHRQIDLERWAHVHEKLVLQAQHAERWRDLVCRFLLEKSGIADQHKRFSERSPSPHNRLLTGFWKAIDDYKARVARETVRISPLS